MCASDIKQMSMEKHGLVIVLRRMSLEEFIPSRGQGISTFCLFCQGFNKNLVCLSNLCVFALTFSPAY